MKCKNCNKQDAKFELYEDFFCDLECAKSYVFEEASQAWEDFENKWGSYL